MTRPRKPPIRRDAITRKRRRSSSDRSRSQAPTDARGGGGKGDDGCCLTSLSRAAPPTLPGGYRVGDEVFFTGASRTCADGDRLVYGGKGEVVGPATAPTNCEGSSPIPGEHAASTASSPAQPRGAPHTDADHHHYRRHPDAMPTPLTDAYRRRCRRCYRRGGGGRRRLGDGAGLRRRSRHRGRRGGRHGQ